MLEFVQALHEAFHTESRWLFVLYIGIGSALAFGLLAAGIAYVVDAGYQRSLKDSATAPTAPPPPQAIYVRDTAEEDRLRKEISSLKAQLADRSAAQKAARQKITGFLNDLNGVRVGWQSRLGQSQEIQSQSAQEVKELHGRIRDYLQSLPQGATYLARFDNTIRSATYPIGLSVNIGGWWNVIVSDSQRLNEFLEDPEFGKP